METEKAVKFSVFLEKPLHKAFKQADVDGLGKMQYLIKRAIELGAPQVLSGKVATPQATTSPGGPDQYKGPDARWHRYLDEILGDPDERLGIEKNLTWAVQHIHAKQKKLPAKKISGGHG